MYGPAPPRYKKTDISRDRDGCLPCRKGRRKCDKSRPRCGRCERNEKKCEYEGIAFQFCNVTPWAARKVERRIANGIRPGRSIHEPNSQTSSDKGLGSTSTERMSDDIPQPSVVFSHHHHLRPSSHGQDMTVMSSHTVRIVAGGNVNPDVATDTGGFLTELCHVADPCSTKLQGGAVADESALESGSNSPILTHEHHVSCAKPHRTVTESRDPTSPHNLLHEPMFITSHHILHEEALAHDRHHCRSKSQASSQVSIDRTLMCPPLTARDWKYLSHFKDHLFELLPPKIEPTGDICRGTEVIFYSLMALGAANMANIYGNFVGEYETETSWIPHQLHRITAFQYTAKALSLIARHSTDDVTAITTSHIILSFVEMELGTVDGLRRYLDSMEKLICASYANISSSKHGEELVRGTVNFRVMSRFVAGPWHRSHPRSAVENFWQELERRACSEPVVFQKLASDALVVAEYATFVSAIRHSRQSPSTALNLIIQSFPPQWIAKASSMSDDELIAESRLLLAEAQSLSQQVRDLQPPEGLEVLEITNSDYRPGMMFSGIRALYFKTHEQAMEAADYAFAHIVTDEALLRTHIEPHTGSSAAPSSSHLIGWVHILSRIALGLDPRECSRRNMYRRGICTMLLQSGLRSCDVTVFPVLCEVVRRIVTANGNGGGGCWEDALFPTSTANATVQLIWRQLNLGRRVLLLICLDKPFIETSPILSCRAGRNLLVHGMEANGLLFQEHVVLQPFR